MLSLLPVVPALRRPFGRLAFAWLLSLLWALGPGAWPAAHAEVPPAGVVRLHFHRVNHDYTGWGLHVWGPGLQLSRDVSWERPLEPGGVDAYGIYFDVPVEHDASGFNFILHRGETKNVARDQSIALAQQGREVWLLENTGTVFTAPPTVGSDFEAGLATERTAQQGVAMLWGSVAAAVLALAAVAWFVQRRPARPRSDLAAQVARLMAVQQELRDRPVGGLDDELTGLPTRSGLQQALDQALGRARRSGGRMAVLFIDLDGFKAVNDNAGHDAGDHVLKVLAQRFKGCLRESDMVARVGGDEFVVVMECLRSPLHALHVGRKLTAAARLPIEQGADVHQVGASIGVAVYPLDGEDAATLLKGADTAMYGAKKGGKDACRFLQADLQTQMDDHLAREQSLRGALDAGTLRLEYLPDLDLAGGRVLGASAVLRWPGDSQPLGLRDLFEVAQDGALAVRLNQWTLAEAVRQVQAWRTLGLPPLRIAVSMLGEAGEALQLAHRQLAGDRAAARGLVLQLPANLLEDRQAPREALDAVHALGVGISLAGLAVQDVSLMALVDTPIDVLKLDVPAFMVAASPAADGLARSLVALGSARAFRVVASGVDNPAQRDWARRMGCGSAVGSPGSGALGGEAFADLLGRTLPRAIAAG